MAFAIADCCNHTKHFQGRSAVKTPIITDDSATRRSTSVRVSAQGDRSFYHQGHALEVVASTGLVWAYLCHSFPSSTSSFTTYLSPALTTAYQFLCNFLQSINFASLVHGSENILTPEKVLHCQITLKITLHRRLSTSHPEERLLAVMESPRKELMSALST